MGASVTGGRVGGGSLTGEADGAADGAPVTGFAVGSAVGAGTSTGGCFGAPVGGAVGPSAGGGVGGEVQPLLFVRERKESVRCGWMTQTQSKTINQNADKPIPSSQFVRLKSLVHTYHIPGTPNERSSTHCPNV